MVDATKQHPMAASNLQKLGLSAAGAKQVLTGQIVTGRADRDRIAAIIGADYGQQNKPVARFYLENAWPSR